MAVASGVAARRNVIVSGGFTAIGRPAILVPLPGAIDADQKNNALVMEAAGGGWSPCARKRPTG